MTSTVTVHDTLINYRAEDACLDGVNYACAICSVALVHNKSRKFPDELCQRCYKFVTENQMLNAPWLKSLIRLETARKKRAWMRRRDGIETGSVSFDYYYSAQEQTDGDDDGYTCDPGDDPETGDED